MDPRQILGDSAAILATAIVTLAYGAGVAWIEYSVTRITPELLQVQVFRKMKTLQNSVLFMGLGLLLWMVMTTLFVADVVLPDLVYQAGVVAAAGFLGWGMFQYSQVLSVPRSRPE